MTRVAYIRVSTEDQDLAVQKSKVEGCDKVFAEKRSGVDQGRPALGECLRYLRDGDVLVCTRADRLARSTLHLLTITEDLTARGVKIEFIDQPELNSGTAQSRLMLQMLAAVAEFERNLLKERQAEGIAKAKEKGVKFGRPPQAAKHIGRIIEMREAHYSVAQIVAETGLSRTTVYKVLGSV